MAGETATDEDGGATMHCPENEYGHTTREHTVARHTVVGVCQHCGRRKYRADPEEVKEAILA